MIKAGRQYVRLVGWLIRDIWRKAPLSYSVIQGLQALDVFLALFVAGSIFVFARNFEIGTARVLGHTITYEKTTANLLLAFAMVGLLLLLQAVVRYAIEVRINRAVRRYEEFSVRRALAALSRIRVSQINELPFRLSRTGALRAMTMDSRYVAMSQRSLLRILVPGVSFFILLAILAVLSPLMVAGALGILAVFAPPLILLGLRVTQLSRDFEKIAPRRTVVLAQLFDHVAAAGRVAGTDDPKVERLLKTSEYNNFMSKLERRINLAAQSRVVSGTMLAVAVSLLTGLYAWESFQGLAPWSRIVVFLFLLQYMFRVFQQIVNMITNFTRYYPQVERYQQLVTMQPSEQAEAIDPGPHEIKLSCLDGPERPLVVGPGRCYYLFTASPFNRFGICWHISSLLPQCPKLAGSADALALLGPTNFIPGVRLRDFLPAGVQVRSSEIRAAAEEVLGRSPRIPDDLDAAVPEAIAKSTDMFVFLAAAVSLEKPPIVVIDRGTLITLDEQQAAKILKMFDSACTFVYAANALRRVDKLPIGDAVIHDGTRIAYLATKEWARKNASELQRLCKQSQADDEVGGGDLDAELLMI